jgi:hypothetical protein
MVLFLYYEHNDTHNTTPKRVNTMAYSKNNISDDEREAIKKALVIYYSGEMPKADAFDHTEPGLIDRYYRRNKKYPDEIKAIDAEARAEAQSERLRKRMAFEAQQIEQSMELQRWATEALKSGLPELDRIASGKPKHVYDSEGKLIKTFPVYPRDQLDPSPQGPRRATMSAYRA